MPTLRYGIYKVLEAQNEHAAAMAKLEAELAAQDTPTEAAERQAKQTVAAVFASVVAAPLLFFFNWFDDPLFPLGTCLRAMPVLFAWFMVDWIAGPPSRASLYLAEQEQLKAKQQSARNAKIRADKIRRGL